jgi:hypothetical protein
MLKIPKPIVGRGGSSQGVATATAYALWEFRSGSWVVKKPGDAEGFHAGSPPTQEGRFEGEIVRKYCEPVLVTASGASRRSVSEPEGIADAAVDPD